MRMSGSERVKVFYSQLLLISFVNYILLINLLISLPTVVKFSGHLENLYCNDSMSNLRLDGPV